ncbi:putative acid proteinase [Cladorrhinum samala]|uniref:Acid proteinase n=1 Tax=Cladorrhinum samala TaxID=585594 RepID=A0AAV9HDT8_9PEZI|nr:putative acid proteinase [Cladorrhinum samala]
MKLITTTFLLSAALGEAATLPPSRHPTPRAYQLTPQGLRLLHTPPTSRLAQSPAVSRIGSLNSSAASSEQAQQQESTKGGAVLSLPSSNSSSSSITSITATYQIPQAKVPTRGPTANNTFGIYAASFHVGIDSVGGPSPGCPTFLRAGVDIFYDGSLGDDDLQRPQAWWQLGPLSDPVGFANFSVREGDVVRVTAGVGEVKVENFGRPPPPASNGTAGVRAEGPGVPLQTSAVKLGGAGQAGNPPPLCGREAGWIVEDFPLAGLPGIPVALADFGTVRFADVRVQTSGGEEKNAEGAGLADVWLQAQGGRLTDCEVAEGGNEVKCDRVFSSN